MMNSIFMQQLKDKVSNELNYDKVKRWTTKIGCDVAKLDLLLIPFNISNVHWLLAAIDFRTKQFICCDSMYDTSFEDDCKRAL